MAGDGTGAELTFQLAAPTQLTRVGLINGYAKNAVVGGRNLNWYVGNRRVLAAQWVFDDGTTVDQPLGATKQMQTIDLGRTGHHVHGDAAPGGRQLTGYGPQCPRLHRRQRGHAGRHARGLGRASPAPRPRAACRRG